MYFFFIPFENHYDLLKFEVVIVFNVQYDEKKLFLNKIVLSSSIFYISIHRLREFMYSVCDSKSTIDLCVYVELCISVCS